MGDRVMIEASMLLHRDSLNQLRGLAYANALENVTVADSFLRMLENESRLIPTLGRHLGIPTSLIDRQALSEFRPILKPFASINNAGEVKDRSFLQKLVDDTENEVFAEIIFEEWTFMTSNSWLFSKSRVALDNMIEAGATAIQFSQKRFDKVTRRLLNKDIAAPLTPNDKAKATAKWIAVGGDSVVSYLEPLAGAVLSTATGVFIMSDP